MPSRREKSRVWRLLWGGLCLRCPRCGGRSVFRTWFTMYDQCPLCHLLFEREPGYFVGAMYVNYGMTVSIVVSGYFALEWWSNISLAQQLWLWCTVGVLLPLVFFRHARGLWLSFDYIFNPDGEEL